MPIKRALALAAIFSIVVIVTADLVFVRREPGRRHLQVKLSLLLLGLASLFFDVYFVLIFLHHDKNKKHISIQDNLDNIVASMADFF